MSRRRNVKNGPLITLKEAVDTPTRTVKRICAEIGKGKKRQTSVRTKNVLPQGLESSSLTDSRFRLGVLRSATCLCVMLLASGILCIFCNSPHTQVVWDVIKFSVGAVVGLFSGIGIAKQKKGKGVSQQILTMDRRSIVSAEWRGGRGSNMKERIVM